MQHRDVLVRDVSSLQRVLFVLHAFYFMHRLDFRIARRTIGDQSHPALLKDLREARGSSNDKPLRSWNGRQRRRFSINGKMPGLQDIWPAFQLHHGLIEKNRVLTDTGGIPVRGASGRRYGSRGACEGRIEKVLDGTPFQVALGAGLQAVFA